MLAPISGLRKRAQIAKTNRVMFIWVAVAASIVGFSLTVAYFLAQKAIFNEKVLAEKSATVKNLKSNQIALNNLRDEANALRANQNLNSIKYKDDEDTLRVILDAMPEAANDLALEASFQDKILAGINGLKLESIKVDPLTESNVATTYNSPLSTLNFSFAVKGDELAIRQVLVNLEKSIRPFSINGLYIEKAGDSLSLSVNGMGYYLPTRAIKLTNKIVVPDNGPATGATTNVPVNQGANR